MPCRSSASAFSKAACAAVSSLTSKASDRSPYAALRELAELGGIIAFDSDAVEITGEDPVFPTAYRVGTAGAAALAATGLAASELWMLRTGRRQHVAVDLRAAAASLRSAYYLRVDGQPPPPPWDPVSGFYPTRDGGWVQLHCNFPHHRDRALEVLGATPDRGAI